MSEKLDVIYNDTCPICAREVDLYKTRTDETVVYHGLSSCALDRFGLTSDQSAREFHVMRNGQLFAGLEAFALLWERIPRLRWFARFVRLPVIRPMADRAYRYVFAPLLYRMHRRRQARLQSRG